MKATATAAKANDDNNDRGAGESGGGGGGGGVSGGGDDDYNVNGDDDYNDNGDGDNDGDDDCLAHDDRIDGGRRGPPAARCQTAVALSSPSGQAPSANATRQRL